MLIRRDALRELWMRHGDSARAPAAPAASDRAFWGGLDDATRTVILDEADRLRDGPWPQPLLSQWAAYARSGDRTAYESALFARNRRIRLGVLAAALEPTDDRILEATDGLWLTCEQAAWCWPAHDDVFARGRMVPEPDRPFVDLGAGEQVALAAWSTLVLGDEFDRIAPGLREQLAAEARERVLTPFLERRDWHWEGTEEHVHNWAPWIHSNLLPAATAFADTALRDRVFALCVDGIDRYLAQLPADGAIDEGFAYWWQGAARAFDALALLDPLSGGAIGRAVARGELSGLAELARFPQRMRIGRGWFASFSDAEAIADPETPWHALFRAASLCGLDDTAAFALVERGGTALCGLGVGVHAGLGRMLAELADIRSGALVTGRSPQVAEDVLLASIGVGIRERDGLTVVVKGGHNGENHNHNDLGSFAVAVDGVPLLPDLGRATYTQQTFSDRRYELWNVRSDWHSTPLPRGALQQSGAQWRAVITETRDGWRLDLSDAYPDGGRWVRTVALADGILRIVDEGEAVADPATRIAVVCVGIPERVDDALLVPGRDGSRGLLLTHDPAEVEIETVQVNDPYLCASWGDRVTRMLFTPASGERWELRGRVR